MTCKWEAAERHLEQEQKRLANALQRVTQERQVLQSIKAHHGRGRVSTAQIERWLAAYMRDGEPARHPIPAVHETPRVVSDETKAKLRAAWANRRAHRDKYQTRNETPTNGAKETNYEERNLSHG